MASAGVSSSLSCVSVVPLSARFSTDDDTGCDSDDCACVQKLGPVLNYIIPSFPVLQVAVRRMRVKGVNQKGEELEYDFFIRDDSSLYRGYPAWMTVKYAMAMTVNSFVIVIRAKYFKYYNQFIITIRRMNVPYLMRPKV